MESENSLSLLLGSLVKEPDPFDVFLERNLTLLTVDAGRGYHAISG